MQPHHQVCLLLLVHMWLCLGHFASQGISADEFEQLSAYMKAIKITPPDKSADDNDCDVGLCPTPDCLA